VESIARHIVYGESLSSNMASHCVAICGDSQTNGGGTQAPCGEHSEAHRLW
jgi:hypothetical protein